MDEIEICETCFKTSAFGPIIHDPVYHAFAKQTPLEKHIKRWKGRGRNHHKGAFGELSVLKSLGAKDRDSIKVIKFL